MMKSWPASRSKDSIGDGKLVGWYEASMAAMVLGCGGTPMRAVTHSRTCQVDGEAQL